MLSALMAVCVVAVVATSKSEVFLSTALTTTSEPQSFNRCSVSRVSPHDVINDGSNDVSFQPPLGVYYAGKRWKRTAKSRGKSGYLRMKSKYRAVSADSYYSNEYWIKRAILTRYDRNTFPARKDDAAIPLYVGMSLYHILDTVFTAHAQAYSTRSSAVAEIADRTVYDVGYTVKLSNRFRLHVYEWLVRTILFIG